jgi:hypothetical protein
MKTLVLPLLTIFPRLEHNSMVRSSHCFCPYTQEKYLEHSRCIILFGRIVELTPYSSFQFKVHIFLEFFLMLGLHYLELGPKCTGPGYLFCQHDSAWTLKEKTSTKTNIQPPLKKGHLSLSLSLTYYITDFSIVICCTLLPTYIFRA